MDESFRPWMRLPPPGSGQQPEPVLIDEAELEFLAGGAGRTRCWPCRKMAVAGSGLRDPARSTAGARP
jgi:hypothetical protein